MTTKNVTVMSTSAAAAGVKIYVVIKSYEKLKKALCPSVAERHFGILYSPFGREYGV
mgnify:CR=1 FL=1